MSQAAQPKIECAKNSGHNAVLAAAGYNFYLLLKWLELLLLTIPVAPKAPVSPQRA